jgi:hypothetical protein
MLKHPQPTLLPQCERPSFTPIQNDRQNYSSIYLNLYILVHLLVLIIGEQNMYFYFLYRFCQKYFSFQEEMSEILLKMYIGLHVKYRLLLADFNENWICSTDFQKIIIYQISWKSVQWEPSFSVRDRGTDMTEKAVACRNVANAPEKRPKRKDKIGTWVGFVGLGLGPIGVLLWVW